MTISTTTSKISYSGNGVTTEFSFPYYFLADGDLVVVIVDSDGVETTQTITTEYTVADAGEPTGGTVTMVTAPAADETLVIYREVDLTQTFDHVENAPFLAESVEQVYDKLTMACQQQQEEIDRSFKAPRSTTLTDSELVVSPGRAIGFNSAGDGLTTYQTGTVTDPNWDSIQNYASLTAAVAAAGTDEKTILIDSATTITGATTVPSTLALKCITGGSIDGAYTLTANGPFEGCPGCFGSSLTVAGLKHINPAWWGADSSAAAAVNDAAFTKSIAALSDNGEWTLHAGDYTTSQVITFDTFNNVKINFIGKITTGAHSGILFDTIQMSEINVGTVLGPSVDWETGYYGIRFEGAFQRNKVHFTHLSQFEYGAYLNASAASILYNNFYFESIYDCQYGLYFNSVGGGSGAVNENNFYCGRVRISANSLSTLTDSWFAYFDTAPAYIYNNNRFYNPCAEALHNGFFIPSTSYTLLISPRFEGTGAAAGNYWISMAGGGASHFTWILGETDFDATKINFNVSRNYTIIGAGKEDTDYQTIITDNQYGGISFVTERNIEQSHLDFSANHTIGSSYTDDYWGNRITLNKSYQGATIPTSGTYRENAVVWNTDTNTGKTMGWLCTANGTMDADPTSMTATTTAASKTVSVTAGDINDLYPGQYIDIVGDGATWLQIDYIDYSADIFYTNIAVPNSVTDAAVTFHDATWTVMPAAGGWVALADDATPSVLGLEKVVSGGTTTITDFDDGVSGQELKFYANHTITITDGTNIFLNGSANWTMTATDMLHLIQRTDGKWYEMGRGDNGA